MGIASDLQISLVKYSFHLHLFSPRSWDIFSASNIFSIHLMSVFNVSLRDLSLPWCSGLVFVAVINPTTRKMQKRREFFICLQLTLQVIQFTSEGSKGGELKEKAKAEAVTGCCSLTCTCPLPHTQLSSFYSLESPVWDGPAHIHHQSWQCLTDIVTGRSPKITHSRLPVPSWLQIVSS